MTSSMLQVGKNQLHLIIRSSQNILRPTSSLPSNLPSIPCRERTSKDNQRFSYHGQRTKLQSAQLQPHQFIGTAQPRAHPPADLGSGRNHGVVVDHATHCESTRHGGV
jgi:hypothetical protein